MLNCFQNLLSTATCATTLRDLSQMDPREVAAGKFDLNYIGLDGNIGGALQV